MYACLKKLLPLTIAALVIIIFVKYKQPKMAESIALEPIKTDVVYAAAPPREITGYYCCFCNETIAETINDPVYVTVGFNYDVGDESRDVLYYWAHWNCLYRHVHPSMGGCMVERYLR